MHAANPCESYRQVATQTAPPGQLVLMLYDGALRFLELGLAGFSMNDPAESNMAVHNNLQRALNIIRELNLSLNMDQGGDFAVEMRRLYDYFDRRICESNLQKRPEGVREVIRHLNVVRNAWATMLSRQGLAPESLSASETEFSPGK